MCLHLLLNFRFQCYVTIRTEYLHGFNSESFQEMSMWIENRVHATWLPETICLWDMLSSRRQRDCDNLKTTSDSIVNFGILTQEEDCDNWTSRLRSFYSNLLTSLSNVCIKGECLVLCIILTYLLTWSSLPLIYTPELPYIFHKSESKLIN